MFVKALFFTIFILMLLTGCSLTSVASEPAVKAPMTLTQMQELDTSDALITSATSSLRANAIRDTALRFGAQGGLAWRIENYNTNELPRRERQLDNAFDFKQLMLQNSRVMPPVIVEAHNRMDVGDDGRSLRLASTTYHIERQAHFVGGAPTWRDYLTSVSYKAPKLPIAAMLPKDPSERELWRKWVDAGWKDGVQQADAIIEANFNRLKRDYLGIIQYHKLRTQGMVSEPYVASSIPSVTGDGSNMVIDDQILQISEMPSLKVDSKQWMATPAIPAAWPGQNQKEALR